MKKHSLKEWVTATRYWSFSVSSMPVVATCGYLFWQHTPGGTYNILNALLALVGVVVFHAAGNIISDYFDYKTGIDSAEAYATPNLVQHRFEPREYLVFSVWLFVVGIAIGLLLTMRSGWPLLVIGGVGVLLTVGYSWMKYHALGDLTIFIIFAILPVLGTSFVVTGSIVWQTLILSLPLGFITISVLHINNTVDIHTDAAAGMHSLPMLLGEKTSVKLYFCYQLLPFLCVLVAICFGLLPWPCLLCLLAIKVMWTNLQKAKGYFTQGRDALLGLDQMSAKLQLVFSLLLSVGLFLSGL